MNKTIKVIDLLNKIANGEEVPKKIRISVYEFEYDKELNTYFNINKASPIKSLVQDWLHNTLRLNNEVEIIEESEQEIDIQAIEEIGQYCNLIGLTENEEILWKMIQNNANKMDKILQAVKQLDRKI